MFNRSVPKGRQCVSRRRKPPVGNFLLPSLKSPEGAKAVVWRHCAALVSPILFLAITGCTRIADRVVLPSVQPRTDVRIAFDSFTNIHYGKMRSLYGWQTTQYAIKTTLQQWYVDVQNRQAITDGTPAQLKSFLENLPTAADCAVSVVYLGSIQSADGQWVFVNGDRASWRDMLTADIPAHPFRIVILDVCNAAIVRQMPAWRKLATITLLASNENELTYDFSPSSLRPVDSEKYYPMAQAWGQSYLKPGWNKHISFLGLMWMEAAAKTNSPPADKTGWMRFFALCGQNAAVFQQTISQRWGSTLQPFSAE